LYDFNLLKWPVAAANAAPGSTDPDVETNPQENRHACFRHRSHRLHRHRRRQGSGRAAGAEVHRGNLEDLDSLRSGATRSDGVIHAGFNHDFSRFVQNCEDDRRAIEAIGDVLAGSGRPLVVTAGIAPTPGRATTEDDATSDNGTPRVSEPTALALVALGVRATVVRLPQVHDRDKAGIVSYLIPLARQKGNSAYVGAGLNRWSAVHRLDAAPVFRLALEKGTAGSRFHAVGEEGVSLREIAEAIGRGLKIPVVSLSPEEAAGHFGWLGMFSGMDNSASSALTQQRLDWHLAQRPGLIDDLDHFNEFAA
jgi:nucleoside-diphosphate-sugar epimerase